MEELTEREKNIWLAGVLESECSFGLYKHKQTEGRRGYGWSIRLSMASVTPALLEQVKLFTGLGNIDKRKGRTKPHWKIVYHWELNNRGSRILLPRIKPYLVIKKKQVELLIEAGDLLIEHTTHRTQNDTRLLEIWAEMRVLNQRGIRVENLFK